MDSLSRTARDNNTSSPTPSTASSAVKRKRYIPLDTAEDVFAFVKQAHSDVMEQWYKEQEALLKQHLAESRDAILASVQPPTPRVYPPLLGNADPDPIILAHLYCQPCISPLSNIPTTTTVSCNAVTDNTSTGASATNTAQVVEMVDDSHQSEQQESKDEGDDASESLKSSMDDLSTSVHHHTELMRDNDGENQDQHSQDRTTTHATKTTTTKKVYTSAARKEAYFLVRVRGEKHKFVTTDIGPPRYLTGTHPPRPSSSATIFLKTHYATEDEQVLRYVPYFGDDDKEDVVSDLYNIEDREKQMEFGAELKERKTNAILDQVLVLMDERLKNASNHKEVTPELYTKTHEALAEIMDEYVDRINQRHSKVILKTPASPSRTTSLKALSKQKKLETYLDAMDSYRPLFCRRCFIYDCNMHSNLNKPSIDLQGELAIQKERDGYWVEEQVDSSDEAMDSDDAPSTTENEETHPITVPKPISPSSVKKRALSSCSSSDSLSQFQKAICERMFLIFQGNIEKMAKTMGAPEDAVADYCQEKGFECKPLSILKEEHIQMFGNKKRKKGNKLEQSMNNYNPTWLKRVEGAEIHPVFVPCNHLEPCSEETCSCIQNAFFCTKHCAWERRSRNFFRGCNCNGRCMTKSCSCFAAKRECDPDLCKACGACTDPPNKPATTQRCRNDNIGMRRHGQLLLGRSAIEDAGWGVYTRHALKKGDYVHEYVGEVISQEEAERRGRIYDKVNRSYLFNLSSDYVVDASRKGNKTRFANHSSKPNCYTKMVNVNGDIRIGLFAKDDIEPQTELFFDYRYDVGMDNDLIIKPGMTVDWMKNSKMANQISKNSRDKIIKKSA